MPRKPRFHLPGVPQHIVQRGNNRQACFFAEADYLYYLDALRTAADKFGGRIHAYVLMTNHVHLLMTPERENAPSAAMGYAAQASRATRPWCLPAAVRPSPDSG